MGKDFWHGGKSKERQNLGVRERTRNSSRVVPLEVTGNLIPLEQKYESIAIIAFPSIPYGTVRVAGDLSWSSWIWSLGWDLWSARVREKREWSKRRRIAFERTWVFYRTDSKRLNKIANTNKRFSKRSKSFHEGGNSRRRVLRNNWGWTVKWILNES